MFIIDDKEFHLTEDDEFTFEAIFIVPQFITYYLTVIFDTGFTFFPGFQKTI